LGFLLFSLSPGAQAQEESLENMETLSSELNAVPTENAAPVFTEKAADLPPSDGPEENLSEDVGGKTGLPASSDFSGIAAGDLESRIQKVLEPNFFAGAPVNPGTLRNLAVGEAPEDYEIQDGDNLYDICDQLIDEADYWPKLWAFNPGIANPHFVYPGTKLRFYPGDAQTPPFLQVVTEDEILPVDKGKVSEKELVREDINGMLMRSEATPMTPVVGENAVALPDPYDSLMYLVGGTYKVENLPLLIPAFIVEDDMPVLGEVVGGSAGSFLVDKGQDIIVKDKSGLKTGGNYTVVRPSGKVRNASGDFVGVRYEFVAQMRVELADKADSDLYRGKVVFNRLGMQPGDILVSYRSVRRTIPPTRRSSSKGSNQMVVGFTQPDSEVAGRGDFVFLDQRNGKLTEGSTYTILQNVRVTAGTEMKKRLPDSDSRVAWVYVVDASASAATGFLISDAFEVRLGDRLAP
jgi:hypothetical protein